MWPPAYIYVAPSLHLSGPQPTFIWPPAYIYVASSLYLSGPQPTFMWPSAYIYVALKGKKLKQYFTCIHGLE